MLKRKGGKKVVPQNVSKNSLRLIQGKETAEEKHYLWLFKNNFFPSFQFPLFAARANLSNITANLTSKGCSHVKALFNCDKEYAFMLKPFSSVRLDRTHKY